MILVDAPAWEGRGRSWSHLASDASFAELHGFAERVGLHPFAYDGDHYDVPSERYEEVLAAGAVAATSREVLAAIRRAGLRFPKRRGDRPVAALVDAVPVLRARHRLDLVLSDREPPTATTVGSVVFAFDPRGRMLLVEAPARSAWEGPGGWCEPGETPREAAARELAEESGLLVPPGRLVPCGYERILLHEPLTEGFGVGRFGPLNHLACYRVDLDEVTAVSVGPEGRALTWADPAGLRERCGAQPWWPLLARLLRVDVDRRWGGGSA